MADKLLINVAHEETRVALVESGRLANFEIITSRADNNKGNIYKGIVHRVNTSLQAAFVDYGAEKQGFLPLPEIHERFYPKHLVGKKVSIQDVLHQGQEIMVQVVKDEIGQKGAGLTTFISVAGRSLAIEANSDKAGISRRVSDDERKRLKKVMNQLDVPEGHGAIMRTAAADQTDDAIHENHKYLMMVLNKVNERFAALKGPGLVHQERGLAVRFIRDYVASSIDEVLIDERETWNEVRNFCAILAPELVNRIKLYEDPRPLFSRYQVEDQIDDIFARRIDLPSGGSIVIDQTEALVAIDVNSGRVKTDDIEETALKTNLEAAAEVARQLKIRDRGGLIVVDFIDMRDKDNVRKVEDAVRDAFRSDKAKVKFSKISEFGLMEISRQRLQGSVMRGSFTPCVTCGGTGQVRSVESSALYLLRRMKETLIRGNYQHLEAQIPVAIANYLLNRKRMELVDLERQTGTSINVRAVDSIPAMQSFFELVSRSNNQARRPKRVLQRIDLVRSEVEKRELEEGEEAVFEPLEGQEVVAVEVPGAHAAREKLAREAKAFDAELAQLQELERAQREADESLRRESEMRAQREVLLAETEKIRALEEARWKGLSLWDRLRAWVSGGLPPIQLEQDKKRDEAEERKKRQSRRDRDEEREERLKKRRSEREDERDFDKEKEKETKREPEKDKDERKNQKQKPNDKQKQKHDKRDLITKEVSTSEETEERSSQLMESGGAVSEKANQADQSKRKRRRRRRGKGSEEGDETTLNLGLVEHDDGEDEDDKGAETAEVEERPILPARADSPERRERRERRDRRRERRERGERSENAVKAEVERAQAIEVKREAEQATKPAIAIIAEAPVVPKVPKFGAIDLRAGGNAQVVPVPPPRPKVQVSVSTENLPPLPKGQLLDLRSKPSSKPAPKAATTKAPEIVAPVAKEVAPVELTPELTSTTEVSASVEVTAPVDVAVDVVAAPEVVTEVVSTETVDSAVAVAEVVATEALAESQPSEAVLTATVETPAVEAPVTEVTIPTVEVTVSEVLAEAPALLVEAAPEVVAVEAPAAEVPTEVQIAEVSTEVQSAEVSTEVQSAEAEVPTSTEIAPTEVAVSESAEVAPEKEGAEEVASDDASEAGLEDSGDGEGEEDTKPRRRGRRGGRGRTRRADGETEKESGADLEAPESAKE